MKIQKKIHRQLRKRSKWKSSIFLFISNMKKEIPAISKDPKNEQGEQLHLDIEIPNSQVEINSVLEAGEAIMSSDEKESSVPKIITTQELKNERDKKRRIKEDSLGRIGEMLR